MEVIPWMRERDITVTATNLKPNTRMYAFFNERDVNSQTRPSGVSQTTTLMTANLTKAATTVAVTSTVGFPDTGQITLSNIVLGVATDRTFDEGDLSTAWRGPEGGVCEGGVCEGEVCEGGVTKRKRAAMSLATKFSPLPTPRTRGLFRRAAIKRSGKSEKRTTTPKLP